jgi:phospholipid transport system substrate-binding protein
MMKKISGLFLILAFVLPPVARAGDMPAPDVLIRNTAQEVLDLVKRDKDLKAGHQKKVLALVEAKVLPHFDFVRMTRLTAGRNWRSATPEQQKQLVDEFRTLMVRTYTVAFTRYNDQTVEVDPPLMQPGYDDEATVKTRITKPGAPSISVDYEMEKTDQGWKVFDLTVEGASLIATYRNTFSEEIQRSGIDGLIKSLADKNHANASQPLRKADSR